jgi:uncharacterized protein YkwD
MILFMRSPGRTSPCKKLVKLQIKPYQLIKLILLTLMIVLSFTGINTSTISAKSSLNSAYDLIAAVNQLRAANGLPAYQVNGALMSAAQNHSSYMAANGTISHTGSGGTRPKDRAVAAGYGGGAGVYVSENIAGGMNWSVGQVIQLWQGDSLHLNTMLGGSYTEVGAGVATGGNTVYYVLDVGYVAGSPGSGSSNSGSSSGGDTNKPAYIPLLVSTPGPDGSIFHEVQPGQALWNIAAVYEIDLQVLLSQNGFTGNAFIHPGDKILIKPADDLPETREEETNQAGLPTVTILPTRTPTVQAVTAVAIKDVDSAETEDTKTQSTTPRDSFLPAGIDPVVVLIVLLVLGGTGLVVLGGVLRRGK